MTGTVTKIIAVTLLLTAIIGSYAGSYYYLVNRFMGPDLKLTAKYKVGGEVSEAIYYPANQIDRLLRPNHWDDNKLLILCFGETIFQADSEC